MTLDSGDELTGLTVVDASNATVVVDAAGAVDTSNWTVDSVTLSADISNTVTAGSAQTFDVTKAQTALVIDSSAANNAATTVNTGVDSTSITLNTGTSKVATVNITADAEIATLDTAATGKLTVTGSSVLTIGQTNAGTLDMTAYTGKTTVTSDAAASVELGSGTNKLTLGDFAYLIAGGEGADTIDAQAVNSAVSVVVASAAGDDVVKINDLNGGSLNFNGGAGNDTLWVNAGGTAGSGTVTLTGIEFVEVENQTAGADTSTITMLGANLDEQTLTLKSEDSIDTVTVTVTVTATASDTTDLSNVATSNVDKVAINGADGSAEVILGSTGNDTIDAGTGTASAGDVLTGNAGSDTFVFAVADSIEAAMDKITDYTATEDKLDLAVTAIEADGSTDVSAAVTGNSATVTASVTNGIMTLSGLAEDRALFDTLAEWVDAAELVATNSDVLAFEFNGSTYVFVDGATQDVIELTGLTGISAVSTTAADTIQIA